MRILEAAETLFADKGFDAVSIRDIAREAQVQSSTIYYYYRNKNGVFKGILETALGELIETLEANLQDGEDPYERLKKYINIYTEYLQRRQKIARLVLQVVFFEDADKKHLVDEYWAKQYLMVERILREGVEAGVFREIDTQMATISIRGMILWHFMSSPITELYPGMKGRTNECYEKLAGETLDLLSRGILRDKDRD